MALVDILVDKFYHHKQLNKGLKTDTPFGSKTYALITPKPELIVLDGHPLNLYPGFKDYTLDWNTHASSVERLARQTHILQVDAGVADYPSPQRVHLEEVVVLLENERNIQQDIYDTQVDVPKREKIQPLKQATRELRRKREELERLSYQESRAKKVFEDDQAASQLSLQEFDEGFALGRDENRVIFFALDRLKNDQLAIDKLFAKYYVQTKTGEDFRDYLDLRGTNFRFMSILKYYKTEHVDISLDEELWQPAEIGARRQLIIAGVPARILDRYIV